MIHRRKVPSPHFQVPSPLTVRKHSESSGHLRVPPLPSPPTPGSQLTPPPTLTHSQQSKITTPTSFGTGVESSDDESKVR